MAQRALCHGVLAVEADDGRDPLAVHLVRQPLRPVVRRYVLSGSTQSSLPPAASTNAWLSVIRSYQDRDFAHRRVLQKHSLDVERRDLVPELLSY
jgi:hypothetical protein